MQTWRQVSATGGKAGVGGVSATEVLQYTKYFQLVPAQGLRVGYDNMVGSFEAILREVCFYFPANFYSTAFCSNKINRYFASPYTRLFLMSLLVGNAVASYGSYPAVLATIFTSLQLLIITLRFAASLAG